MTAGKADSTRKASRVGWLLLGATFVLGATTGSAIVWLIDSHDSLPRQYVVEGTITTVKADGTAFEFRVDPGTPADHVPPNPIFVSPYSRGTENVRRGLRVQIEVVVPKGGGAFLISADARQGLVPG